MFIDKDGSVVETHVSTPTPERILTGKQLEEYEKAIDEMLESDKTPTVRITKNK